MGAAGLARLAGQAVAAGQASTPRVGDRLGAAVGESSDFRSTPVIGILAAAGVLAAAIVVFPDDDSESD